jgi:hypothetical protein
MVNEGMRVFADKFHTVIAKEMHPGFIDVGKTACQVNAIDALVSSLKQLFKTSFCRIGSLNGHTQLEFQLLLAGNIINEAMPESTAINPIFR